MGYGLVAIPKHLWKAGDVRLHQQLLCRQAGIQANLTLKAHRSDFNANDVDSVCPVTSLAC